MIASEESAGSPLSVTYESRREELFYTHIGLARSIAHSVLSKLPPHVELKEIESHALIGLWNLTAKFKEDRMEFGSWISFKLRCEIIDELRKQDPISRSVRNKVKRLDNIRSSLEQKLGREVSDLELSKECGISIEEIENTYENATLNHHVNLDAAIDADNEDSPNEHLLHEKIALEEILPGDEIDTQKRHEDLRQAITTLTEKEQRLLRLHFWHNMQLKIIAEILFVTESRACQMFNIINQKLKKKLERKL